MSIETNPVRSGRLGVGTPPSLRRWYDRSFAWESLTRRPGDTKSPARF